MTNWVPVQAIRYNFSVGAPVAVSILQALPSSEVTRVPLKPTATKRVPDQAMLERRLCVPLAQGVQTFPSGEVTMEPLLPTAANKWLCSDQVIPQSSYSMLDCWTVQFIPSDEVSSKPLSPTITNSVPNQATYTIKFGLAERVRGKIDQLSPSREVRMV